MPDWGDPIEGGFFRGGDFHEYRNTKGERIPSSTQIFDLLKCSDFSKVDPEDLAWKRQFGNALHRGVELLVFDKLDWESCDEEVVPGIVGIEEWLRKVEYIPEHVEERRIATVCGMHFGMTADHRGSLLYKGIRRPAILDLKTGSKASPTWNWQLGSYYLGSPKPTVGLYVGAVLQVNREGRVVPHWVDLIRAAREFQCLLATANLLLNAGLTAL